MCDGSVHTLAYTIDGALFSHLGSRNDGKAIDSSAINARGGYGDGAAGLRFCINMTHPQAILANVPGQKPLGRPDFRGHRREALVGDNGTVSFRPAPMPAYRVIRCLKYPYATIGECDGVLVRP